MEKDETSIECKTCRQFIPSYKMFLHEGFCQKNNIFCEHCDQVFLKKDYDEHILEISKNLSSKNKETIIKRLNTDFKSFKSEFKNNNTEKTIDSVKLNNYKKVKKNQVVIPVIEEYKIRKPIVIAPNGDIIYGKNNDYLLSLFNFDLIKRNVHEYPKYDVVFKTEYNYDLSNNSMSNKNIIYNKIRRIKKTNHANILYNNNIFNEKNSILIYDKHKEKKNNLRINLLENNFTENHINSINIKSEINENDRSKSNGIIENYRIHKVDDIAQRNKNNIIINNQIITYNTHNNVNEVNNIFNGVRNNQSNGYIKEKNLGTIINKSTINLHEIKKYNSKTNYIFQNTKRNINYIINKKEDFEKRIPLDSISKDKYKNNTFRTTEKKPENGIKKITKYSILNADKKNVNQKMVKCPFCNIFTDNLTTHNNLCKNKTEYKNKKYPVNSIKRNQKKKELGTIKLELDNKKEDAEASSPEEKKIIFVKKIKPTSRINYKEKLNLNNDILQRGKSQEVILRKRNKKKKPINSKKAIFPSTKDFPEDTRMNTNIKAFPNNSSLKNELTENYFFKKIKVNERNSDMMKISVQKRNFDKKIFPKNNNNKNNM